MQQSMSCLPAISRDVDIASLSLSQLREWMQQHGHPLYRAQQLFEALHARGLRDVSAIAVLPQALRQQLQDAFAVYPLRVQSVSQSQDGTRKYRMLTHDNHLIESVWIPNASREGRHALCISSQVGCAMGCRFCATAAIKLKRHLTAGEITAQLHVVAQDLQATFGKNLQVPSLRPRMKSDEHLQNNLAIVQDVAMDNPSSQLRVQHSDEHLQGDSAIAQNVATGNRSSRQTPFGGQCNVVFMGMGEPLHNCEQVMRAIGFFTHPKGLGMAARRITVSTSGIVPAITQLMNQTGVHLAVSLNATTDEVRSQVMPVNRKWSLQQLLDCCRALPLPKRRRITFEYVLLAGVNDSLQDARRLVKLLADLPLCRVNLIPFNSHPLSPFKRPCREDVLAFQRVLLHKGMNVFIRRTRGDDVDAACGMLGGKTLQQARKKTPLPVL